MTATTIRVQMAQRKDTAANWTSANPILLSGEIGYETDTKKFKIGNGSSNWNSLAYLPIPDGSGNLTITGNLEIGSTGSLTFEGSTADGFETTLAVTNPTADRTITLPDRSGTVITSGDTGTVTSTMLADGTIVNADISASAEIAVSKLANGTANQIITTDGTDVSWSSNLNLAGNATIQGDLTVNGTTTTIDTQTLLVEDKNIEMGVVATPTDVTADGGGITLRGTTNKTINWVDATGCWTSSENLDLAAGKSYFIDGAEVINGTSLGINITDSSLTSVGTLGSLTVADFVFAGTFIPDSATAPFMGMYAPAANTLGFTTDSVQRITIDPNGNLTINGQGDLRLADSDSSNWVAFQAPATVASNVTWTLPSADGTSGQVLSTNGSGTLSWSTSGGTSISQGNTSATVTDTGSDGRFVVTTEGTERLRVDSSGRLLVGTSSTRQQSSNGGVSSIQIEGTSTAVAGIQLTSNVNNASGSYLFMGKTRATSNGGVTAVQSGDLLASMQFAGADGSSLHAAASIECYVDGTPGTNDMPGRLVFSTTADGASSPTERMRINNTGAFKASVTGSYAASANAHEFVANDNNNGAVEFYHAGNSTPYGLFVKFTAADPNNTSQYVFRALQNTDTNIYTIFSNGTVSVRSDARYKKNIETARNGYLEDLSQLRVVKYNWYNHDDEAPKELGFVAQEVEQVFPGLVMNEPEKDEEGNETGESCKSIKFSVFTPMLVKALQEANAKIEQLEARLSALETA